MKYQLINEIALKSQNNKKTKVFKSGDIIETDKKGLVEAEYVFSGVKEESYVIIDAIVEDKKPKNVGGRPTKFKPEYCQMLIDFVKNHPTTYTKLIKKSVKANGTVDEEYKVFGNRVPFLTDFADSIGVSLDAIENWANPSKENKKKYPGFNGAYNLFKRLQKQFLINNGLAGLYNPAFAIFTAKNITDMSDKQESSLELSGNINLTGLFEESKKKKDTK